MRNCNYALEVKMADRLPEQAESDLTYLVDQKNGDRMMKQLLSDPLDMIYPLDNAIQPLK